MISEENEYGDLFRDLRGDYGIENETQLRAALSEREDIIRFYRQVREIDRRARREEDLILKFRIALLGLSITSVSPQSSLSLYMKSRNAGEPVVTLLYQLVRFHEGDEDDTVLEERPLIHFERREGDPDD